MFLFTKDSKTIRQYYIIFIYLLMQLLWHPYVRFTRLWVVSPLYAWHLAKELVTSWLSWFTILNQYQTISVVFSHSLQLSHYHLCQWIFMVNKLNFKSYIIISEVKSTIHPLFKIRSFIASPNLRTKIVFGMAEESP